MFHLSYRWWSRGKKTRQKANNLPQRNSLLKKCHKKSMKMKKKISPLPNLPYQGNFSFDFYLIWTWRRYWEDEMIHLLQTQKTENEIRRGRNWKVGSSIKPHNWGDADEIFFWFKRKTKLDNLLLINTIIWTFALGFNDFRWFVDDFFVASGGFFDFFNFYHFYCLRRWLCFCWQTK